MSKTFLACGKITSIPAPYVTILQLCYPRGSNLSFLFSSLTHLLLILKCSSGSCCGCCRRCSSCCSNSSCSRSSSWVGSRLWKGWCIRWTSILLRVIIITSRRNTGCASCGREAVLPLHVVLCYRLCCLLRKPASWSCWVTPFLQTDKKRNFTLSLNTFSCYKCFSAHYPLLLELKRQSKIWVVMHNFKVKLGKKYGLPLNQTLQSSSDWLTSFKASMHFLVLSCPVK